jgi:hypothetical protein
MTMLRVVRQYKIDKPIIEGQSPCSCCHHIEDSFALRAIELYDTMSEYERTGFKQYLRDRIEAAL